MSARHAALEPVAIEVFLSADPELALVHADPAVWSLAHPCECEGMCVCDDQQAPTPRSR